MLIHIFFCVKTVTNELKSENDQLKEKLIALTNRQKAIEDMLLALSTDLPKEKFAMINKIDEKRETLTQSVIS